MAPGVTRRSKRRTSSEIDGKLLKLAIGGGVAFWATNFATSLLPVAAEYRTALSISYLPMVLVESSLGGMIIATFVSYGLVRFFDRIPSQNPMVKAVTLSFGVLVIATIMTWGATSRLEPMDAWHYFLLSGVLNVPRFVMLGLVVGYLYRRLYRSSPSRSSGEGMAAES